ncbi:MAG: hypothetical protein ABIS68_08025 [Casimicrobiaceae bacterium]
MALTRDGTQADAQAADLANAMLGDQEGCLAAGMHDYVTKPIRVEALVDALNNTTTRKDS